MSDQITMLDSQIENTRRAAIALATKAKEVRARLKERFLASVAGGADKTARALHGQLAELSADQAFEEEHLAALHERRATIAADIEAARAKAERQAKVDAFKALVAKRDASATVAEQAITKLGEAIREVRDLNIQLRASAPAVGLRQSAIDIEEQKFGLEASLYEVAPGLFPERPRAVFDDQGRPMAKIAARLGRSGAALVSMLEV